jgi:hypothetical protein
MGILVVASHGPSLGTSLTKGLETSLAECQANTESHSLELLTLRLNVETAGVLSSLSPSSTICYR